jgi:opacity protein-like surface antigen
MLTSKFAAIVAVAASLAVHAAARTARAQDLEGPARFEAALAGGIQALNQNDTGLPDNFLNIPVVATLTYNLTPVFAVDGEFTWMIPVEQSVDLGAGGTQDRKSPDVLAYQANLRANFRSEGSSWMPYVTAGAGAITFLSNTDADRVPQLAADETAFAMNLGAGVAYDLGGRWAIRADFREFVAFPSDDAAGLSAGGDADRIWMERGTVGAAYRF